MNRSPSATGSALAAMNAVTNSGGESAEEVPLKMRFCGSMLTLAQPILSNLSSVLSVSNIIGTHDRSIIPIQPNPEIPEIIVIPAIPDDDIPENQEIIEIHENPAIPEIHGNPENLQILENQEIPLFRGNTELQENLVIEGDRETEKPELQDSPEVPEIPEIHKNAAEDLENQAIEESQHEQKSVVQYNPEIQQGSEIPAIHEMIEILEPTLEIQVQGNHRIDKNLEVEELLSEIDEMLEDDYNPEFRGNPEMDETPKNEESSEIEDSSAEIQENQGIEDNPGIEKNLCIREISETTMSQKIVLEIVLEIPHGQQIQDIREPIVIRVQPHQSQR